MQRALQDQHARNRRLQKERARPYAQVPQAADDEPHAPQQLNLEEMIWAHLVRLQVDHNFTESLLFQEVIKHMDASPFSEAIQIDLVPERFTILKFKLYSGTTDPVVHF